MTTIKPLDPLIIAMKSNDARSPSGVKDEKDLAVSCVGKTILNPRIVFSSDPRSVRADAQAASLPFTAKTQEVFPETGESTAKATLHVKKEPPMPMAGKRGRAEFEKGEEPRANGGAGKPASEPAPSRCAPRSALKKDTTKRAEKLSVRFNPRAEGIWIKEGPYRDESKKVSLSVVFEDRYTQEGKGRYLKRDPAHKTQWGIPESLKDRSLDALVMGSSVTFDVLLQTLPGCKILPNTLDCSLQQMHLAAEQSIYSWIASNAPDFDQETVQAYAKFLAAMFAKSIEEYDSSAIKEETIPEFLARFAKNIRLHNAKQHALSLDAFIDLILTSQPGGKAFRTELMGYLEECLDDADRDCSEATEVFATLAQDIYTTRPNLLGTCFLADASQKHECRGIPRDLRNAPEFETLHKALMDGSWKEDEVRTVTLSTCFTPEELERLIALITRLFAIDQVGYAFLYSTRGLGWLLTAP